MFPVYTHTIPDGAISHSCDNVLEHSSHMITEYRVNAPSIDYWCTGEATVMVLPMDTPPNLDPTWQHGVNMLTDFNPGALDSRKIPGPGMESPVGAELAELVWSSDNGNSTICDAKDASVYMNADGSRGCRCMICGNCGKHTGNGSQGHYWNYCKVTGSFREFHFCCPDACELESGEQPIEFIDEGTVLGLPMDELHTLIGKYVHMIETETTNKLCKCEWIVHPDDTDKPKGKRKIRRGEAALNCPVHTKEGFLLGFFDFVVSDSTDD